MASILETAILKTFGIFKHLHRHEWWAGFVKAINILSITLIICDNKCNLSMMNLTFFYRQYRAFLKSRDIPGMKQSFF